MAHGVADLTSRLRNGATTNGPSTHPLDAEPLFDHGLLGAGAPDPVCATEPSTVLLTTRSIRGRRETNQDRAAAARIQFGQDNALFAGTAADGMGGYEGGELAAALAVTHSMASVTRGMTQCIQDGAAFDPAGWVRQAFIAANAAVQECSQTRPELADMGCTLTLGAIVASTLYLASVGDSRAYRFREGRLEQLTRDDSLVQQMVDEGLLHPEDAQHHPLANVITRSLGGHDTMDPLDVTRHILRPKDVLLLCTDGFWKAAEDSAAPILNALVQGMPDARALEHASVLLVDAAWRNGSDDNISIALMWYGNAHPCIGLRKTQRY
jgi:protein phosphatase